MPETDQDGHRWRVYKARFPWTGEMCWRVEAPKGQCPTELAYFHGRLHTYTWNDAIAVADDEARRCRAVNPEDPFIHRPCLRPATVEAHADGHHESYPNSETGRRRWPVTERHLLPAEVHGD